jgi:DNA-nicking Smr family endonuclease
MLEIPLDIKDSAHSREIKAPKIAEIDLHFDAQRMKIHQIESKEILNRQLQLLGEEIRESMAHKVDRLIVIHGIGKGILKNEVIQLSKKYPKITVRSLSESRYKNCAIALDFDYL